MTRLIYSMLGVALLSPLAVQRGPAMDLQRKGSASADDLFAGAEQSNATMTWVLRIVGFLLAAFTFGVQAQSASGKFTCDGETYNIESAVAAWVPEKKSFTVWAFTAKFGDDELKAYAFIEGARDLGSPPKAFSDKAFQKAGSDMQAKARAVKSVMLRGNLKESAQKVEWANLKGGALMYVKCLTNVNLNFNLYPGDKNPKADVAKAFKSFDFILKDGAKAKYQTVAFSFEPDKSKKHTMQTKATWDYKVDAKVYTIE